MSETKPQIDEPSPTRRWYRIVPSRLLIGLVFVEAFLWFSGWLTPDEKNGLMAPFAMLAAIVAVLGVSVLIFWFLLFVASRLFRFRFQVAIRPVVLLLIVCAIPSSWAAAKIWGLHRHRRTVERIEDVLVSLEDRYPDGVPQKKWDNAVAWTWNAIGNCLAMSEYLTDGKNSEQQFARFADELEQRAQGRVGPETIDWIWDEIERLSKNGKSYSERWRPVHGGRLKESRGDFDLPRSQYPFVSTVDSLVFHKRECSLVSKLPWRQVDRRYNSREAAISNGMSPCTECNP